MATPGKLEADIKGRMATQLSKTAQHLLERLGTILKQGWAHPEIQHGPLQFQTNIPPLC